MARCCGTARGSTSAIRRNRRLTLSFGTVSSSCPASITVYDVKPLFLEFQAAGVEFHQALKTEPWGALNIHRARSRRKRLPVVREAVNEACRFDADR